MYLGLYTCANKYYLLLFLKKLFLFIYLAVPGVSCRTWDLINSCGM